MKVMCDSCQLSNLALKVDQLKGQVQEKGRAVERLWTDLEEQRKMRRDQKERLESSLNGAFMQLESTRRALQIQRMSRLTCQSRLNQIESQKVQIQKQLKETQAVVNYRIDELHKCLNQTKSMLLDNCSSDSFLKDELIQLKEYISASQSFESQTWQRLRLQAKTIIRDAARPRTSSESKQPIDLKILRLGED